jgi:hypothetical protein
LSIDTITIHATKKKRFFHRAGRAWVLLASLSSFEKGAKMMARGRVRASIIGTAAAP